MIGGNAVSSNLERITKGLFGAAQDLQNGRSAFRLRKSVERDVPAQVLSEKKGDEGGKVLLFIKMCQDKGIQARYRSGLEPSGGKVYLREWAEVSADGKEWIPAYLGGKDIPNPDSIILINNDSNGDLFPAKTYPRSDNVDFLRGEVEWDGGNLYFPLWNSEITIEYL